MEGWIGTLGVAAGAVLGWWGKWWTTRKEWEREDNKRWLEDRRRLYLEMLEAIKEMRTFIGTVEAIRRDIPIPDGMRAPSPEELNSMFNKALTRLDDVRQDISLIASDEVLEQLDKVWRLSALCEVGRAQHPDLLSELDQATEDFRLAVRSELGAKRR